MRVSVKKEDPPWRAFSSKSMVEEELTVVGVTLFELVDFL
jgi:hypothetical protein